MVFYERLGSLLEDIKIVLVETSHPGNIGAVARAMKNMAVTQLVLVAPKIFPSADATARASGADDLLYRAKVCGTLQEAIADCSWVIGASARRRTISWPEVTPRECAEKKAGGEFPGKMAIVFGRENSGLNNQELDACHFLLRIPCNSEYSSLNLAAAVQVVCYELFLASGQPQLDAGNAADRSEPASAEQMEQFYTHMHEALVDIDFLQDGQSKSVMRRLRRIYNRAALDAKEVDILRGILRMSQGHKKAYKD